jgi:hypothetical protein
VTRVVRAGTCTAAFDARRRIGTSSEIGTKESRSAPGGDRIERILSVHRPVGAAFGHMCKRSVSEVRNVCRMRLHARTLLPLDDALDPAKELERHASRDWGAGTTVRRRCGWCSCCATSPVSALTRRSPESVECRSARYEACCPSHVTDWPVPYWRRRTRPTTRRRGGADRVVSAAGRPKRSTVNLERAGSAGPVRAAQLALAGRNRPHARWLTFVSPPVPAGREPAGTVWSAAVHPLLAHVVRCRT